MNNKIKTNINEYQKVLQQQPTFILPIFQEQKPELDMKSIFNKYKQPSTINRIDNETIFNQNNKPVQIDIQEQKNYPQNQFQQSFKEQQINSEKQNEFDLDDFIDEYLKENIENKKNERINNIFNASNLNNRDEIIDDRPILQRLSDKFEYQPQNSYRQLYNMLQNEKNTQNQNNENQHEQIQQIQKIQQKQNFNYQNNQISQQNHSYASINSPINNNLSKQKELFKKRMALKSGQKNYQLGDINFFKQQFEWYNDVQLCLKNVNFQFKIFNISSFRQNQACAINAAKYKKDVFVTMPTGGGKSLIFQITAITDPGVTLVVMPLISLIYDQVAQMRNYDVYAVSITSSTSMEEYKQIINQLLQGSNFPKIIYLTPEKISKSDNFMSILFKLYDQNKIDRFVIDEAHCVSQWGRDFRPDYVKMSILRQNFPNVPIIALTATATERVKKDIIEILKINNCILFQGSFNRPNLIYEIKQKPVGKLILDEIATFIKNKKYEKKAGSFFNQESYMHWGKKVVKRYQQIQIKTIIQKLIFIMQA